MSSSKDGKRTTTTTSSSSSSEDEGDQLRRGPWTIEEDNLLHQYIAHNGEGRWNLLAKRSGLKRTGKSCRLRWLNYLKPDVKRGNLSPQEQFLILDLHFKWGNKWSKIAQQLPGRTDNEIKNYWRTRIQRQARHLKIDAESTAFKEVIRCTWMPRLLQKAQESYQPRMSLLPQNSTFPQPLYPQVLPNSPQPQLQLPPLPPPPPPPPQSNFITQDSDYHEQSSDSEVLAGSCISSTRASHFSENSTSPFHAAPYDNIDSNNYIDNSEINNNYVGSFDFANLMYQGTFGMQNTDGHMGKSIWINSDFDDGLWNNNMGELGWLRR